MLERAACPGVRKREWGWVGGIHVSLFRIHSNSHALLGSSKSWPPSSITRCLASACGVCGRRMRRDGRRSSALQTTSRRCSWRLRCAPPPCWASTPASPRRHLPASRRATSARSHRVTSPWDLAVCAGTQARRRRRRHHRGARPRDRPPAAASQGRRRRWWWWRRWRRRWWRWRWRRRRAGEVARGGARARFAVRRSRRGRGGGGRWAEQPRRAAARRGGHRLARARQRRRWQQQWWQ